MRKIVVMNRISIDGCFAGPNGEIDWFIHDPEVDAAVHEFMSPDTVLFGRLTYQMFEGYWPAVTLEPNASPGDRALADDLTRMTKVVFTKTLQDSTWENTRLIQSDPVEYARELKGGSGPDITIFGSGSIVQQLAGAGLVDKYLLIVTPIVLGNGKPLFKDGDLFSLKLVETQSFKSGNVVLHYDMN
jgi:dihydrofolate reductase